MPKTELIISLVTPNKTPSFSTKSPKFPDFSFSLFWFNPSPSPANSTSLVSQSHLLHSPATLNSDCIIDCLTYYNHPLKTISFSYFYFLQICSLHVSQNDLANVTTSLQCSNSFSSSFAQSGASQDVVRSCKAGTPHPTAQH